MPKAVKFFNEKAGRWMVKTRRGTSFTTPPPEARNKRFTPFGWRWKKGHPKAGKFAPNPETKVPDYDFTSKEKFVDKETGEIVDKEKVDNFRRGIKTKGLGSISTAHKENLVRKRFGKVWIDGRNGEVKTEAEAVARNRNLERAQIYKRLAETSGKSYQEIQQIFKGRSLEELRGKFEGIDPDTGVVNYSPVAEDVGEKYAELGFFGSMADEIETP